MNRPIKFRAWDNKNNVMRDWDYVRMNWTLNILNGDSRTEIMQFTGLHDKNGKEIYEGDIVHHYDGGKPYEMKWNKTLASFRLGGFTVAVMDDYKKGILFEVIGSIYENPELLAK